jgi:hypothetical protein
MCKVTGITRPGNHVFKFEVGDGTNTVAEHLTVPVYPANTAPVIERAEASPAELVLPDSRTTIAAVTRDPDGDLLSHWWRVKSSPAGARLAFTQQGGRDTKVSGLTVAGTYVFELTVVDRTRFVTRDVVVTVAAKGPATRPDSNR